MRRRADLCRGDHFYRFKTYKDKLSLITEGGKQAGVSAAAKVPHQMWAAGEFHVDPLKGVCPKAGPSSPVLLLSFFIFYNLLQDWTFSSITSDQS